jgi:DNA polymerase
MDSGARNRLRLWLRSEKALGLPSVPRPAQSPEPSASFRQTGPDADTPAEYDSEELTVPPPPPEAPVVLPPTSPSAPRPVVVQPQALFSPAADQPSFDAPLLSPDEKRSRLAALDDKEVRGCTKCRLCETRTQTVFGEGDADAKVFFIGEGPGENEDLTGRPFVGRAGEMLNKWIAAMGLKREQVYIANIVKCRPPGNRVPAPDEVATCTPYLQRQLEIIRPKVIVTLGLPSAKYMLQSNLSMGRLRGNWHEWRGIKLMPTFHPAYVLRSYNEQTRAAVWSDLKKVMAELNLPLPPSSKRAQ